MTLRTTIRRVYSARAFSATVIALVAGTVGPTVLLTTVATGTIWVPSTVTEPERVFRVYTTDETRATTVAGRYGTTSLLDMRDAARGLRGKAELAAFVQRPLTATIDAGTFVARTQFVTGSFFAVMGVRPFLGAPDSVDVSGMVISHEFWQKRLGGRSDVLGEVIRIEGQPVAVRAVMRAGFRGTDYAAATDLWFPITAAPLIVRGTQPFDRHRDERAMNVVGRLGAGASMAAVQGGLDAVTAQLQRDFPELNARRRFLAEPFPLLLGPSERARLGIDRALASAAAILVALLALGYASVGNLFAVRALLSRREMAIRKALGGSEARLQADSILRVIVLVVPGIVLGWALARAVFGVWLAKDGMLAASGMPLSGWTLAALLASGVLATIALALVPARWIRTESPASAMNSAEHDLPLQHTRVLWGLVSVQVAVACCAGALVQSGVARVRALERVDLGFDLTRVIDGRVRLRASQEIGPEVRDGIARLVERLEQLPNVESAAVSEVGLLRDRPMHMPIGIVGTEFPRSATPNVRFDVIGDGYFETLGIRVLAGGFRPEVFQESTIDKVVVNESFAKAYLEPGRELLATVLIRERYPARVVGVVANAVTDELRDGAEPRLYLPALLSFTVDFQLMVRLRESTAQRIAELNAWVAADRQIERAQRLESLAARREQIIAPVRTISWLMWALATAVAALVTIGVYGILSVTLTGSRRGLAIRSALGAPAGRLVGQCVRPVVIAFGLGVAVAALASLALPTLVPGVKLTLGGVATATPVLGLPIALACVPLLRRALRRSPAEILRT